MKTCFHITLLAVSIALFFSGCTSVPVSEKTLKASVVGTQGYRDFVPTDPLPSPLVAYYDSTTGQEVTKAWAMLTNEQTRRLLPILHTDISVAKRDNSGNLTYLVAKATAEAGDYRVVMDYAQYRPETVTDDSAARTELGIGRIGIGMRMTADIHTNKADINLGSLFALGIAASTSTLSGQLSVDIIGIGSADVGNLMVSNAKIDETSIQKTLEAMAAIKTKIPDPGTTLTPFILAVKPTKPNTAPSEIKARLAR